MSKRAAPYVLFVFTEVFANGGIQRFNKTILDACNNLGIPVRVLSLNDTSESIARQSGGRDQFVSGFSGNRRRFALAVLGELVRSRFDWLVIGHVNFLTLFVGMLTIWRLHVPRTIMIAHGIEVWSGMNPFRRLALPRIDRILCVSHFTRNRILEQVPKLREERLLIFPNALADSWGHTLPARFAQNLPERFILSVTRLEPGDRYKGIATVIEAFSMLADQSVHYLIVGQGGDLPFLELVARRCGVQARVHFVRGVSDAELISLYQQCDAFVLPSGKEGFGIVFLEAMFFRAPVIAAAEKGATDVVRDGDTGLSVRFGDTIALKEAIERLGANSALRERLRDRGRTLVCGDGPFTFACFTRRCAEVFEVREPKAA